MLAKPPTTSVVAKPISADAAVAAAATAAATAAVAGKDPVSRPKSPDSCVLTACYTAEEAETQRAMEEEQRAKIDAQKERNRKLDELKRARTVQLSSDDGEEEVKPEDEEEDDEEEDDEV